MKSRVEFLFFPDRHGVGGGAGGKRTALACARVAGRCSLLSATVRSQSHIGLLLRSQFHQQMHFLRGPGLAHLHKHYRCPSIPRVH